MELTKDIAKKKQRRTTTWTADCVRITHNQMQQRALFPRSCAQRANRLPYEMGPTGSVNMAEADRFHTERSLVQSSRRSISTTPKKLHVCLPTPARVHNIRIQQTCVRQRDTVDAIRLLPGVWEQ